MPVFFNHIEDIPSIDEPKPKDEKHRRLIKEKFFWFLPLYKKDTHESIREWKIGYNYTENKCYIEYGVLLGAVVKSDFDVDVKGNKTNIQQALIRMRRRYIDKIREGYSTNIDEKPFQKPMLADKYKEKTKLYYPVAMMPKLDGIRCIVRKENNEIKMVSRSNTSFDHLLKYFKHSLKVFMHFLPLDVDIDGELYNHDISFNSITSFVRKTKNTVDSEIAQIDYYIFDCIAGRDDVFEDRWVILKKAYKKYLKYVNNYTGNKIINKIKLVNCELAYDKEEMMEFYSRCLSEKYEGAMIHQLYSSNQTSNGFGKAIYRCGVRCSNIMKLKPEIEEEAEVIGVTEAKGRESGTALIVVRDIRGNEIITRPATTFEIREEWLKDPSLIIGKQVTLKYFELTPDGVPRGPVSKDFRDYE